jgi:hypothetical protein
MDGHRGTRPPSWPARLSLLSQVGVDETALPPESLAALAPPAGRPATTVEISEAWRSPSPAIVAALREADVSLVRPVTPGTPPRSATGSTCAGSEPKPNASRAQLRTLCHARLRTAWGDADE